MTNPLLEGQYSINNSSCYFTRSWVYADKVSKGDRALGSPQVAHLATESFFFTSFFILCYSAMPVCHNPVSP